MSGGAAQAAVRAYVGLGSNLCGPVRQVREALAALAALPRTTLVSSSALYRSAPMGAAEQPEYVNAVACLDTRLAPHALLAELQRIEARHGRVRGARRWGPRTLDLDLLLYADLQCADAELTLPHPGVHQRPFVLQPLHDISPRLHIPGHGRVDALLEAAGDGGVRMLCEG